jgi:hypothetical protein
VEFLPERGAARQTAARGNVFFACCADHVVKPDGESDGGFLCQPLFFSPEEQKSVICFHKRAAKFLTDGNKNLSE